MYQGGTHVDVFDAGTTKFCSAAGDGAARSLFPPGGTLSSSSLVGGEGAHDVSSKSSLFVRANAVSARAHTRGIQWQISDSRKTVNSKNKKYYESSAKGYVLQLENASIETVQHSNATAKAQQLTQPMVCAQIYVKKPEDKFTIEFVFSEVETRRDRRRVVLSTAFLETKTSPLHCQVPIVAKRRKPTKKSGAVSARSAIFLNKKNHEDENDLARATMDVNRQFTYNSWVNFIVPIPKLLKKCFGEAAIKQKYAIEKIRISGTCLIKRVMTLRGDRLSSGGFFGEDDYVPASVDFPNGVDRKSILFLSEEDEEVPFGAKSTKTSAVYEEGKSPARKKQKDNDVISPIATPARLTYRERRHQHYRRSGVKSAIKSSLSTAIEALDTNYEKLTKITSRSPSPPSSFSSFSSARSSRDDVFEKKTVRFAPDTPLNEVEDDDEKNDDASSSHSDGSMISRSTSPSHSQAMSDDDGEEEKGNEEYEIDSSEKMVSFLDVVPLPRTDLSVRVPNSRRSNLYRDSAEYKSSSESDSASDFDDDDDEHDDERDNSETRERTKGEHLPPSNWDAALGFSDEGEEEA